MVARLLDEFKGNNLEQEVKNIYQKSEREYYSSNLQCLKDSLNYYQQNYPFWLLQLTKILYEVESWENLRCRRGKLFQQIAYIEAIVAYKKRIRLKLKLHYNILMPTL